MERENVLTVQDKQLPLIGSKNFGLTGICLRGQNTRISLSSLQRGRISLLGCGIAASQQGARQENENDAVMQPSGERRGVPRSPRSVR